MDIDSLKHKIENLFLELGFEKRTVGEKRHQYFKYKNCYCKITYLEKLKAFVIESADNITDAVNGILEDGDLYFIDIPEEDILSLFKKAIVTYYMV